MLMKSKAKSDGKDSRTRKAILHLWEAATTQPWLISRTLARHARSSLMLQEKPEI